MAPSALRTIATKAEGCAPCALLATLTAWCERQAIPYQGVSVGTIKHHATGKGHASKQDIMASVKAKGYQPHDENEADALALLEWVRDQSK